MEGLSALHALYVRLMKNIVFISTFLVSFTCIAEEPQELDRVLKQVFNQVRTSDRDRDEEAVSTPEEVIEYNNARDILHESVKESSDMRIKIAYAIVSLNAVIEYLEAGSEGNVKEDHPMYTDYLKMQETQKYLASEYLALEAKRKAEQGVGLKGLQP